MRAIAWAVGASVALIVVYLALGGASYAPAKVADPCAPRDWRDPQGVEEVAEQIALSGLDGAACELDVSREEMVLALANQRVARRGSPGSTGSRTSGSRNSSETGCSEQSTTPSRQMRSTRRSPTCCAGIARSVPVDELLDLLEQVPGFGF